jgi:hypothetical protein
MESDSITAYLKNAIGSVWLKRAVAVALFLTLAIPSFINVRFDHDWGDDFAMYIIEAKKIATGQSLSDLGYIYDRVNAGGGPPAYPVGFPLMLAPVYRFFGISFRHFHYLMSVLAATFSLLTFLYLKRKTGVVAGAFALAMVLAFNPWLIDFKNAVLSDLPFSVFVLLAVIAVERRSPYWAGLAMGFALSIRSAGVALFAGLLMDVAYRWVFQPNAKESRRKTVVQAASTLLIAAGFRFLISAIFRTPGSESGYLDQIPPPALLGEVVRNNVNYYIDTVRDFIPSFQAVFLSKILWISLVSCSLAGFLKKVKKGPDFSEFFVFAYLVMILMWTSWQGFRFLLPVVPMMLYYAGLQISELGIALFGTRARYAPWVAVFALFFAVAPSLRALQRNHRNPMEGPMSPDAQEAYREIQRRTPRDAKFLADKPRALALFTDRSAAFDVPDLPPDAFRNFVKSKNIRYKLIDLAGRSAGDAGLRKQIPPDIVPTDVWSSPRYLILRMDWN